MNKYIFDLCRKNEIVIKKFSLYDEIIIIESENDNYFCKKRDVNYLERIKLLKMDCPILIDYNDYYELYLYDEFNLNRTIKCRKLIDLLVDIHNDNLEVVKFNKLEYDELYDEILLKIDEVWKYYLELQDKIESCEFPNIYNYFLIINISSFYNILGWAKYYLEKWHSKKDYNIPKGYIINNPYLDNFCYGKYSFFLNCNDVIYDMIIYDIVKFYKKEVLNCDIKEYIDYYFDRVDIGKDLFFVFICIPNVIKFSDNNYDNILKIRSEINYIEKTISYVLEKDKENEKTN